jgi:hypothetical protein
MYGLYIDDVKGTCSPITNTMCVKYKKKMYCCFGLVKVGLLQLVSELLDKVQWVYEMQKMLEVTQKKKICCIDKCYMMVIK